VKLSLPRWRSLSARASANLQRRYLLVLIVLLLLWLTIEIIARLGAEMLWFEEVGYLPMYLLRLSTQGLLGVSVFAIAIIYLLGNLALAQRLKSADLSTSKDPSQAAKYLNQIDSASPSSLTALNLRWLLFVTIGLSLLIGAILVHYLQVAMSQWEIDPNLPNIAPPAPLLFRPELIWGLVHHSIEHSWIAIGAIGLAIAMLIYPQFLLRSISIVLSFSAMDANITILPIYRFSP
jgi:uncharacterized protein